MRTKTLLLGACLLAGIVMTGAAQQADPSAQPTDPQVPQGTERVVHVTYVTNVVTSPQVIYAAPPPPCRPRLPLGMYLMLKGTSSCDRREWGYKRSPYYYPPPAVGYVRK